MSSENVTKEQLIQELRQLRMKVADLKRNAAQAEDELVAGQKAGNPRSPEAVSCTISCQRERKRWRLHLCRKRSPGESGPAAETGLLPRKTGKVDHPVRLRSPSRGEIHERCRYDPYGRHFPSRSRRAPLGVELLLGVGVDHEHSHIGFGVPLAELLRL